MLNCFKDFGSEASCTQLSLKYGRHAMFYNLAASRFAERVAKKTGCYTLKSSSGKVAYWPILFYRRSASEPEEGSFIWKLRSELAEALKLLDFVNVPLKRKKRSINE